MKKRRILLLTEGEAGTLRCACRTAAEETSIPQTPYDNLLYKSGHTKPVDVSKIVTSLGLILDAAANNSCGCGATSIEPDEHDHSCEVWMSRTDYRRVKSLIDLLNET